MTTDLKGLTVVVAGAGALGLAVAVRLAQAGARVTVCDPAAAADNASGVAAGMLAPAFESVLDPVGGDGLALLRAARDAWPALLDAIGGPPDALDRSGALLAVREADLGRLDGVRERMSALGLESQWLDRPSLRALQPGLAQDLAAGVFTADDWRLEPRAVLPAMNAGLERAGGRRVRAALARTAQGWRLDGRAIAADLVVIATGAAKAGLAAGAPELGALEPVKGQILHFQGPPWGGPSLRSLDGYIAPHRGGAIAGASMEVGRDDRVLDPAVLAGLQARAAALVPALASVPAQASAGVRAATPDGLPLVGRSAGDARTILAAGARRNGWLLAPLVAEIVVALAAGRPAPAFAAALDPRRFG